MKIKFKESSKKQQRKKLEAEIQDLLDYMRKLGPGDEYNDCVKHLKDLNELLDELRPMKKVKEALPWVTLCVTFVGTVVTPLVIADKAYQNEEVDGKLKNGTVWNILNNNRMKNQTPKIDE